MDLELDADDLAEAAFDLQRRQEVEAALRLWERVAALRSLSHLEETNRLICRRRLGEGNKIGIEVNELLVRSTDIPYSENCVLLAVLCAHEAGDLDTLSSLVALIAADVELSIHNREWNVFDLPGIPTWVTANGMSGMLKDGKPLIACFTAAIATNTYDCRTELSVRHLISLYQEWHEAMNRSRGKKNSAWWKFWERLRSGS